MNDIIEQTYIQNNDFILVFKDDDFFIRKFIDGQWEIITTIVED